MIEVEIKDDAVHLRGRFDASQVDKAARILDTLQSNGTIDCSGLEYISSAGIGLLLRTYKRLRQDGGTLTLVNLNQRMLNIFRVAGLDRVFDVA